MKNWFLRLYLSSFLFLLSSNVCFSMQPVAEKPEHSKIDGRDIGFERYYNSPCYSKLGFSIFADKQELDRKYSECEHEYYLNIFYKIALVVLLIVVIVLLYRISVAIKKK